MATSVAVRQEIAERLEQALKQAFPGSEVDTRPALRSRVHAVIVSKSFNGVPEHVKQKRVWDVARRALGDEVEAVSMIMTYGTDELM